MKSNFSSDLLGLCAFLLAFAVLPLAAQTETVPDVANTYQINSLHTGAIASALSPPLTIRWSVDLHATVSYPLIADGKIFVLAGDASSGVVNLYALDPGTGNTLWGPVPIPEGAYWWAAAAYDNGMVFVVPDAVPNFSAGAMFAFDATDGTQLWSATLTGQYLFNSAPTPLNGVVYTGGAGVGGTVYAVRESDGTVLWTASVANGNDSSPVVTPTGVYVSYVCPQVYRFNPQNGHQTWNYNPGCDGGGGSTPSFYSGSLYVLDSFAQSGYNGLILHAADGSATGYFNSLATPAFYEGVGFYVETSGLTAFNTETGATLWTASPSTGDSYASPVIIVNGVAYVGTSQGNVLGYAAKTGKVLADLNVGAPISAFDTGNFTGPLAGLGAAGRLLVVPASTTVVALEHLQ